MQYDEFLKAVEERTGIVDREEAERTATAVLQALSERLSGGEPKDLLSQLPAELRQRVRAVPESTPMTPDEFVAHIASELQLPVDEARDRVRGVLGVLREAVTAGEFEDVMSQLDRDYADLVR
jgi:uncharacterized protein (DUF2267 family)